MYVNRPAGRVLAAFAHQLRLTPNQVTLVSGAFTFAGIVLVATAPPSVGLGVGVWLLLAVGYAWDSADGQVARLRGGGSVAGEWLDHVIDAGKIVALPVAVTIGLYRYASLPTRVWLLIPLCFAVISTVTFFGMILNDLLRSRQGAPQAAENGGSTPLRAIAGLPLDYGILCLSFVLWGWPTVFLVVYGLLAAASLLYVAAALPVWFGRMRQL